MCSDWLPAKAAQRSYCFGIDTHDWSTIFHTHTHTQSPPPPPPNFLLAIYGIAQILTRLGRPACMNEETNLEPAPGRFLRLWLSCDGKGARLCAV